MYDSTDDGGMKPVIKKKRYHTGMEQMLTTAELKSFMHQ